MSNFILRHPWIMLAVSFLAAWLCGLESATARGIGFVLVIAGIAACFRAMYVFTKR